MFIKQWFSISIPFSTTKPRRRGITYKGRSAWIFLPPSLVVRCSNRKKKSKYTEFCMWFSFCFSVKNYTAPFVPLSWLAFFWFPFLWQNKRRAWDKPCVSLSELLYHFPILSVPETETLSPDWLRFAELLLKSKEVTERRRGPTSSGGKSKARHQQGRAAYNCDRGSFGECFLGEVRPCTKIEIFTRGAVCLFCCWTAEKKDLFVCPSLHSLFRSRTIGRYYLQLSFYTVYGMPYGSAFLPVSIYK